MRVQLIFNPVAGPRDVAHDLEQVVSFLRTQGWETRLTRTFGPGDATTYAREAANSGYDMVVAVGGDGTLSEVADGLVGTECIMGVLPVGTGNLWAHMLNFPVWSPMSRSALLDAAKVLVEGRVRVVDLGRAGGRCFVLWLGVGFDAQIARDVEPHRDIRRGFGNLAYVVSGLALGLAFRGTRATVVVDGRAIRQRVILIIAANAQLYGPSWRLAPQAQLDDGLLDLYIFKGGSILDILRYIGLILLGKHIGHPKIESYRVRRVEIRAGKSLPYHVDGNPAGHTPVHIEVLPKALRVIVPNEATAALFQDDPGHQASQTLAQRIFERLRWERERWREGN
ncbi:MAG: diacylglycerol kinase family lipid kinase [Anaerolineae bacterium]|nr:diacylglycerol kinase family lipid kinase [Anaerolineae bacterium]